MSADHRKPIVAFVVLACLAAGLIGIHRADARGGQFFASLLGVTDRVEGALPQERLWSLDEAVVAGRTQPLQWGYSTTPVAGESSTLRPRGTVSAGTAARNAQRSDRQRADARDLHGQPGRRLTTGPQGRKAGAVTRNAVKRTTDATGPALWRARKAAERVTRAVGLSPADRLSGLRRGARPHRG